MTATCGTSATKARTWKIRNEPKDELWVMSVPASKAPAKPAYVRIDFKSGMPVAIDGVRLAGHDLIARLNALAGKHAVGQVHLVENRLVGIKSRGAYETPGGTVLYEAIRCWNPSRWNERLCTISSRCR